MKISTGLAASLGLFYSAYAGPLAAGHTQPRDDSTSRQISSVNIQRDLGAQLSKSTTILGPGDPAYSNATHRWETYAAPRVPVIVEVAAESDVAKIVKYCNKNGIDFLAYNTGHGSTATLGRFNGVMISLGRLNQVTIQPDGKSAWLQGGTQGGPVSAYLWGKGHVTTTGACDCVGVAGAGLGGGHGRLEGIHGMISDNIRQLNVVLANGSTVRVNSTSNVDLYWAMRGAGHNFGIVTSTEMNIYPRGPATWLYKNYLWKGDKLNDVFKAINALHGDGTTPVNMTYNNGLFMYVPALDISKPVISWQFSFRGSEAEAAKYFKPFDAIAAVSVDSGSVPYPSLAHAQATGLNDPACTSSILRLITTVGLRVFNLTTEQQIYDTFTKRIAQQPNLVSTSPYIIHEGYSTEGLKAVKSADTAYPFRNNIHLTQFQGNLAANATKEDQDEMWKWAREVESLWYAGQPTVKPNAYTNYANGFETVQDWYGHEPWRVAKLRKVKAQYDPSNRFRYYNPVN